MKRVAPKTSEAVDDYLKAILDLGGADEQRVTSNALAERLGVRAASVTGMLQKLAGQRPPLVQYEKHHGVRLTAAGKRRAWELVRHHRLLELFLHDVLKYSWMRFTTRPNAWNISSRNASRTAWRRFWVIRKSTLTVT